MFPSSSRLDLSRASVLLVDDNLHSLELLQQVFLGFRVRKIAVSGSAEEARELMKSKSYDLIVIDCEMPKEDGIDLIEYVRSEPKLPNFSTSIILASAHTPVHKVMRARNAGANMVIRKPIVPAILLSRIDWLARNTRQFVESDGYSGPDRRFKTKLLDDGVEERRADAIALTSTPDRAMSQDDIDSLFG